MDILPVERRADARSNSHGLQFDASIVRHGLIVQRQWSTPSAVEYLKAKGVHAAVIQRVLSRQSLRTEDRQALAPVSGASSA